MLETASHVKCVRCGKKLLLRQAIKVADKFFSSGCYEHIKHRQYLRSRILSPKHINDSFKQYTCPTCGTTYYSSNTNETICGFVSPRCCFCCQYSSQLKYKAQKCPLESYIAKDTDNVQTAHF